jgi:hypothetical protein
VKSLGSTGTARHVLRQSKSGAFFLVEQGRVLPIGERVSFVFWDARLNRHQDVMRPFMIDISNPGGAAYCARRCCFQAQGHAKSIHALSISGAVPRTR